MDGLAQSDAPQGVRAVSEFQPRAQGADNGRKRPGNRLRGCGGRQYLRMKGKDCADKAKIKDAISHDGPAVGIFR